MDRLLNNEDWRRSRAHEVIKWPAPPCRLRVHACNLLVRHGRSTSTNGRNRRSAANEERVPEGDIPDERIVDHLAPAPTITKGSRIAGMNWGPGGHECRIVQMKRCKERNSWSVEAHDAIAEFSLEVDALRLVREALAIRAASQGEGHPDLIWTLSLWIEALRRKHRPESALEAARLGERRLALRRTALAGAPDELEHSLRELIDLYTFEYNVLDTGRVEELRRELAAFPEAGGGQWEA